MRDTLIKRFILFITIIAGIVLVAAAAEAGNKKQFCKGYAATATWQYHQSMALGCGYQGAYWHGAKGLHRMWCMTQPRWSANAGNNHRNAMLNQCEAQGE